jgi:hypothetical protein
MPKTDFENIEPLKRYRRRTDRSIELQTDRSVIPIKGFHPLIKEGVELSTQDVCYEI